MPRFLTDLARDLRDRRLLVPAIALVIALVAVPVLLANQAEPAPPAPSAPVASDDSTAVESAVLTEQAGVRNYHKRLAAQKRKNPFRQQFALPTKGSVSIEGGEGEAAATSTETTDETAGGAGVAGAGAGTTVNETTQVDEADTSVSATAEEPVEVPKPEIRFYAGRIDVVIGPLGDAKTLEDVRYLDFLPSESAPVVSFIGLDGGGDAAVFSVTRDVTETSGDGHCSPKQRDGCQFLTLRTGEERTLKYADGKTYRLKLLDTRVVRVPDPRQEQSD